MNFESTKDLPTTDVDLAQIYHQLLPQLQKIPAGLDLDEPDCCDILQDVYLQILPKKKVFSNENEACRYLYRMTVNRCLLEFRQRKRQQNGTKLYAKLKSYAHENRQHWPDQEFFKNEEHKLIRDVLQTMEVEFRAPLVLKYFVGLNATEIGIILKLKPATIRSRLRQGRLLLAGALQQKGLRP